MSDNVKDDLAEINALLKLHFRHQELIDRWYDTPNTNLLTLFCYKGQRTPRDFINSGKIKELLRFVRVCLKN